MSALEQIVNNSIAADIMGPTKTPTNRGDLEKILAMLVLGVGSFFAGILPAFISERNRRRFPLTTSLLLCFGAGILLATALVHILPEVRQQMPSNYAEISLCCGFFFIYFIDEFIHYFFGEAIQHSHGSGGSGDGVGNAGGTYAANNARMETQQQQHNCHTNRSYGAIGNENEPLLHAHNDAANGHQHHHRHQQVDHEDTQQNRSQNSATALSLQHSHQHCDDEAEIAAANARICHTSHTEPCEQTMTGTLGLFVALSLHSAIEGLAIGVQNSSSKVLFLLGAVACHKFVMSFCLGLELRSNSHTNFRSHFVGILVFAFGAICGIGIGMLIIDIPAAWNSSALSVVQALAGGTLFYVTVCEVIPREKSRWHQNAAYKAAGFAQFFAIASGFTIMCVINYFLADDS